MLVPMDGRSRTNYRHPWNEAKSSSRHRANDFLTFPIVADCASRGVHTAADRRLRYDSAVPEPIDEFILFDDLVPVFDQQSQQIERLGLYRDPRTFSAQLEQPRIQLEGTKFEYQSAFPFPAK